MTFVNLWEERKASRKDLSDWLSNVWDWVINVAFSPAPWDTHHKLNWAWWTLTLSSGEVVDITSGTTWIVNNTTYIYYDKTNPWVLLTETDSTLTVGWWKLLVWVCDPTVAGNNIAYQIFWGKWQWVFITAAEIRTWAITADKITANAITADKISVGAVWWTNIRDGAITTNKIESWSITTSKLSFTPVVPWSGSNSVSSSWYVTSIDASSITVSNINANNITSWTITGRTIQTASSWARITLDSSNWLTANDWTRVRVQIPTNSDRIEFTNSSWSSWWYLYWRTDSLTSSPAIIASWSFWANWKIVRWWYVYSNRYYIWTDKYIWTSSGYPYRNWNSLNHYMLTSSWSTLSTWLTRSWKVSVNIWWTNYYLLYS